MGRGGGRPGEEKRQRGKGREEEGESDQGSEVREGGDREEVKTSQRQRTGRERGKWLGRVQRSGTHLRGKIINVNLTELRVEEWKLWFLEEMG